VTDNSGLGEAAIKPSRGLNGNPARTGQLISDDHPYFPSDCNHCAFHSVQLSLFSNKKKDCYHCKNITKAIDAAKYKERRILYKKLCNSKEYKDVELNKSNGGVMATHIGHVTHNKPSDQKFFNGLTSTDLELECQKQLFKLGHSAILCDESKKSKGNFLAALDLCLDDEMMDIRSVTGNGWYSNIFKNKEIQLAKYNAREDVSNEDVPKGHALCLYFHKSSLFNDEKMQKSIRYFRYERGNNGKLVAHQLQKVICVIRGEKEIRTYTI
jgi:hypothetical protein